MKYKYLMTIDLHSEAFRLQNRGILWAIFHRNSQAVIIHYSQCHKIPGTQDLQDQ